MHDPPTILLLEAAVAELAVDVKLLVQRFFMHYLQRHHA